MSIVAVNDEVGKIGVKEGVERVIPQEEVRVEEVEQERGSMEPLRLLESVKARLEEIDHPVQVASIPVVTERNLQLVKRLCVDLEMKGEKGLDEYPESYSQCYEDWKRVVGEERATEFLVGLLRTEVELFSKGNQKEVSREELIAQTTQTATLFMRDYVVGALVDKDALDQEVIIRNVEGWFERIIPTLFEGKFGEGGETDLGFVSGVIGTMTSFLRDNNQARQTIMAQQPRNWLYQQHVPADLEDRMYTTMRAQRDNDRAVLDGFSERLLTLFERKEGKPLGEVKEMLKGQVSVVMEALIDTVLSPQFSQMLACGFLEDDEIAEEIMGLQSDVPTVPGRVPEEFQREVTKFVSELIDFGNPRYSSWIMTSMIKTHFMRTETEGNFTAGYRAVMRVISSPVCKDEIAAFLQNAFAKPQRVHGKKEEWVKAATLGVRTFRNYAWDEKGVSKLGQVVAHEDIPRQLYAKIIRLNHTTTLSVGGYLMPSIHTFGQTLTSRVYNITQSPRMMRLYAVQYLVRDALIPQVEARCALLPSPQAPLPVARTVSHELGERATGLIGDYLQKYVSELYLKSDSPLISGVVDLGVSVIQSHVTPMITNGCLSNEPYNIAQQQMIVEMYGSLGPFLCDYAAAIKEAKKNPLFAVYEKQGRSHTLIIREMEKVRGTPLKISDRDIEVRLEALSNLLIKSHESGLSDAQKKLLESSRYMMPKLLKGAMDLMFSPEMMSQFMTNILDSIDMNMPDDPHHQYQKWDDEVLQKWNSSLFMLVQGFGQLGEPKGKIADWLQKVNEVGALAEDNLGVLFAKLSSGPSPLLSPAATLTTVNMLEKVLFTEDKSRRMEGVFNVSKEEMARRETAMKMKIQEKFDEALPVSKLHHMTQGWIGEASQTVVNVGQTVQSHMNSVTEMIPSQLRSTESPLGRWASSQLLHQANALGLSGLLDIFLPKSGESRETTSFSDALQRVLYGKVSEAVVGENIFQEYKDGNPVVNYLNNMSHNMVKFFHSKDLMRAYVYNYVLSPTFFKHMIANIEMQRPGISLALQLPGSLYTDMAALSWGVPGNRNPQLSKTSKMSESFPKGIESERFLEAAKASPMISTLLHKLQDWNQRGVDVKGCVNTLEDPQAFLESSKELVGSLSEDVISEEEKAALIAQLDQGEFPLVFRYVDLKMTASTPAIVALFGSSWKKELSDEFLSKTEIDGAFMHHVEVLQVLKSYDTLPSAPEMEAVMEILEKELKGETLADKLTHLFKETLSYVKDLTLIDRLFLEEICQEKDPTTKAIQMLAIRNGVVFWDKQTEAIHEMEDMTSFEPQIKEHYSKLGTVLSELLIDPLSDGLKMAISNSFRNRYRAQAFAVAPKVGEDVVGKCRAMCSSSKEGNEWKLQLIKSAEKSIIFSGCYLGGELFNRALDEVRTQLEAKPELDVKIIGSEYMLDPSNHERITALEKAYPDRFLMKVTSEVEHYQSPISGRGVFRTNHTKLLVVDYGKYYVIGGSGMQDRWATPGTQPQQKSDSSRVYEPLAFRDADVVMEDGSEFGVGYALYLELLELFSHWGEKNVKERIINSFNERFIHMHPPTKGAVMLDQLFVKTVMTQQVIRNRRRTVTQSIPVQQNRGASVENLRYYSSGPDSDVCQFHEDLVRDVKEAKKQIDIQHMYFHPSPELLTALIDASNRGVVVNLFTNRDGGDMPLTHKLFAEISRSNWKALFEGKEKRNINIYEFNVAHTTYHKKVVCVDAKTTYIGSSNIGKKSLEMSDQEMNVRLESPQFGSQIQQTVNEDRSLFTKVPDSEAPNIRIDQAAIAHALDFVLKPWL